MGWSWQLGEPPLAYTLPGGLAREQDVLDAEVALGVRPELLDAPFVDRSRVGEQGLDGPVPGRPEGSAQERVRLHDGTALERRRPLPREERRPEGRLLRRDE
jgi:hypothetical protein